jgi:hypothetical protein
MSRLVLVFAALAVPALGSAQLAAMDPTGTMRSPIMILGNADVQKEIKLDKKQTSDMRALRKEYDKKLLDAGKPGSGNPNDLSAGMSQFKAMAELGAEYSAKALALLNLEQTLRYKEIRRQIMGPDWMLEEESFALLDLSEQQIIALKEKQQEAQQAMFEKMRTGGRASGDAMKNYKKDLEARMLPVLSPEQQAKYKELLGKPYPKADKFAG